MQMDNSEGIEGDQIQVMAYLHFGNQNFKVVEQKTGKIHLHIDVHAETDQWMKDCLKRFCNWIKCEFPTSKHRRKVCWQWWVDDTIVEQYKTIQNTTNQRNASPLLLRKLLKIISTKFPQPASWNLYPPLTSWSEWKEKWMNTNTNTRDVLDHLMREGEILHRREIQAEEYQKIQTELLPGQCTGNVVGSLFYRKRRHRFYMLLMVLLSIPLGLYAAVNMHQVAKENTESWQNNWRQIFLKTYPDDQASLAEIYKAQLEQISLLGQLESFPNSCEMITDLHFWTLHHLWIQQQSRVMHWKSDSNRLQPKQFTQYRKTVDQVLKSYEGISSEVLQSLWLELEGSYGSTQEVKSENIGLSLFQARCDSLHQEVAPYSLRQWQTQYEKSLEVLYEKILMLAPDSIDREDVPFQSSYALPAILSSENKTKWAESGFWECPQNFSNCHVMFLWDSLQAVMLQQFRQSLQAQDWSVSQWAQWWQGWENPVSVSERMQSLKWYFSVEELLHLPVLYRETIKPLLMAHGEQRQRLLIQLSTKRRQSEQKPAGIRPTMKILNSLVTATYQQLLSTELKEIENQWQRLQTKYTGETVLYLHSINQDFSAKLFDPQNGHFQRWIRENPLIAQTQIFGRDSLKLQQFLSQIQRGQQLWKILHPQTGSPIRMDVSLQCSLPHEKIQLFWLGDSLELLPEQSVVSGTFTLQGGVESNWGMMLRGDSYRSLRVPAIWMEWLQWLNKRKNRTGTGDSGKMEVQLYLEGEARYTAVDLHITPNDKSSRMFLSQNSFEWQFPVFPEFSNQSFYPSADQNLNLNVIRTSNKEYPYDS